MRTKPQTAKTLWVTTVSLGNRKSCPCCKAKLDGRPIYSFGEYINAKWRNVSYACEKCYDKNIIPLLKRFKAESGREVQIDTKYCEKQSWMITPTAE